MRRCVLWVAAAWLLLPGSLQAQQTVHGSVTGSVVDSLSRAPLENVSVALRDRADSTRVRTATTGLNGAFEFTDVPAGTYRVEASLIGHAIYRSPPFALDAEHATMRLGAIGLRAKAMLLPVVEVTADKRLLGNAGDRRIYNVDHDLIAKSSTASDVLQNIPSVQVDIDGNVSLRGSPDVLVLVNGSKSALMGKTRADVLQQLPASGIERIEVITNPSARYTAEGTAGIINIVMKRSAGAGLSGDATAHLGANGRHNETLSFSAQPSPAIEWFGSGGFRDDRRQRHGVDDRVLSGVGSAATYREINQVHMRPRVGTGNLGMTYHVTPADDIELSGEYFRRRPPRDAISTIVTRGADGGILSDFDRLQTGYEWQTEGGGAAAYEHRFAKADEQLRIEGHLSDTPESETAHFLQTWRTPLLPSLTNDVLFRQNEWEGHLTADYTRPLGESSKWEAGYALDYDRQDIHSNADSLDLATRAPRPDPSMTYRFRVNEQVDAAYATYERGWGAFQALGGMRVEYTRVMSDRITGAPNFIERYASLYPSLHLSYDASSRDEVQLSYSRRIRRPESDDLNPFPEFTDPYNMDAGNPRLRPESTHSLELGYRVRTEHVTFTPSVYYRYKTDGFTRITVALTDSTFLRTMANLGRDQSAGFEPVLALSFGSLLQANASANLFREQIDASNLGFPGLRSVNSWSGTGNLTLTPWPSTAFEATANYRSARLTPQGQGKPSFIFNAGARQMLYGNRLSLTLAVTDVFRTQRQETELDVGGIEQHVTTHRDSRIVYAGLTYHYGQPAKKGKEKELQYEDAP